MLRIIDKENKIKFLWKDEDEEPIGIDELILKDQNNKEIDNESIRQSKNKKETIGS